MDGQGKDVAAYLVAQSLHVCQSGGVLLGGDDASWLGQSLKGLVDATHILGAEAIVVGKGELAIDH